MKFKSKSLNWMIRAKIYLLALIVLLNLKENVGGVKWKNSVFKEIRQGLFILAVIFMIFRLVEEIHAINIQIVL